MFRYFMLALFPSMLPTILMTSFVVFAVGGKLNHILFIGVLSGIINPVTYLFSLLLGYVAYRFDDFKKRVPIQTLALSVLISALSSPLYIIKGSILLMPLIVIFAFSLVLSLIISSLHLLMEKIYFTYFDKGMFSVSTNHIDRYYIYK